jgi:hypothetical protein
MVGKLTNAPVYVKLIGFVLLVVAGISVAGTVGGRAAAGSDLGNDPWTRGLPAAASGLGA